MKVFFSLLLQARSYIKSMPDYQKKPFREFFLNANPHGRCRYYASFIERFVKNHEVVVQLSMGEKFLRKKRNFFTVTRFNLTCHRCTTVTQFIWARNVRTDCPIIVNIFI